jgi:hypothetical protein
MSTNARAEDAAKAKPAAAEAFPAEALEFFEARVRPILAENCVRCHGAKKQSSELRLDSRPSALGGGANGPALVPGKPDESLLIQAVRHSHDEIKMPPKGKLPDAAIDTLTRWVAMGAPWSEAPIPTAEARDKAGQEHWAFRPVRAVAPPTVEGKDAAWVASPIDAFILARLGREGLTPSPRADRRTLIRRATFDLTGLPPTPEEVEAFEADPAPDAFARIVDRLLASPAYGERWGRYWLDVARYADSKGYVAGNEEQRYPYAYTYRDYVIRSFNDDKPYDRFVLEQIAADQLDLGDDRRPLAALGFLTVGRRFLNDRNEIIDDRIDVVGRGLLGLTVSCARCHDHKFDPIPTDDYYSLYGVFASTVEPDELPLVRTPTPGDATRDYDRQLRERTQARDAFLARCRDEIQADFRARVADYLRAAADLDFNPRHEKLDERGRADKLPPERLRGLIARWRARLDATRKAHDPIFAPWHAFAALPAGDFAAKAAELAQRLPEQEPKAHPLVARSFAEAPPATMAEVVARYGTMLAEAEARWQERLKADPAAKSLEDGPWEALRQVLHADDGPLTIPIDAAPRLLNRKMRDELTRLKARIAELAVTHPGAPPRAMAVNDAPSPTEPHVFIRGNPGRPGKRVPRQFLELLSGPDRKPFAHGSGRLELARAIVRPDNPLTARVLVNRIWLNHFGAGLVGTPSDFGLRSDPPTHPELLDYLADEFVRGGWSIKAMHRRIMLSNVYQQRSDNRPDGLARDPQDRLLWKFNRRRLDFEATRDAILAVSGRLDPTLEGRPVALTTPPFSGRRTVYGFVDRQNLDGLFRTFDFASPDTTSPQRYVTTVPQQALFLMNSPFVIEQARQLAERLESASADPEARVRQLYRLLFGRAPGPRELALGVAFTRRQAESAPSAPAPSTVWQYGHGAFDPSSGRVGRFEPFPYWTGSAWQFGPQLPDPKGDYMHLKDDGGHVGRDAEHAVIRRWVAPRDAVLDIQATLRHDGEQGDGVRARIVSGRRGELGSWTAHNAKVPTRIENCEVEQGETIDFVVDCREEHSFDTFVWSPTIRAKGASPNVWSARSDFQGPPPPTLSHWEAYAQVLLLTNEFAFID